MALDSLLFGRQREEAGLLNLFRKRIVLPRPSDTAGDAGKDWQQFLSQRSLRLVLKKKRYRVVVSTRDGLGVRYF